MSVHPESPATGRLHKGFLGFPLSPIKCWERAIVYFSCNHPNLNLLKWYLFFCSLQNPVRNLCHSINMTRIFHNPFPWWSTKFTVYVNQRIPSLTPRLVILSQVLNKIHARNWSHIHTHIRILLKWHSTYEPSWSNRVGTVIVILSIQWKWQCQILCFTRHLLFCHMTLQTDWLWTQQQLQICGLTLIKPAPGRTQT